MTAEAVHLLDFGIGYEWGGAMNTRMRPAGCGDGGIPPSMTPGLRGYGYSGLLPIMRTCQHGSLPRRPEGGHA